MADLIQLLPEPIANQIAAGEVIQRPASVVKELLENAVDAGGTQIKLVVKEAGKRLVQVVDNGCAMSATDARMSFERHATSKIRHAEDLFAIRTMGFRGEALASIAAVAQVEMRTRRKADELGTRLQIEHSQVLSQEPESCPAGTRIAVKNLFFNLPARRNFLKSNTVEMRHITEEFQRVAIANPDILFTLHHNDEQIYHLPPGNLRQRLTGIFGSSSNKKLVPLAEETDLIRLHGFVGKPEFAKKTRGDQFLFVNERFIKSNYLNHAVINAYEGLLPKDTYPFYAIFIEIDPKHIDINVHPTKQEIKFKEGRMIYDVLRVAVRHGLGQHAVMPTLDFDQESSFNMPPASQGRRSSENTIKSGAHPGADDFDPPSRRERNNRNNWEALYESLKAGGGEEETGVPFEAPPMPRALTIESQWEETEAAPPFETGFRQGQKAPYQVHQAYIVSQIKSGFLLIDQQAAHERILYERYLKVLQEQKNTAQRQLFARKVDLAPHDAALLRELLPEIQQLGFDIEAFGADTFVINGVPAEMDGKQEESELIETLLEQYKQNVELRLQLRENVARSMARSASIKRGQLLSVEEMQALIDQLFACETPFKSPKGRNCFISFELDDLEKRFEG